MSITIHYKKSQDQVEIFVTVKGNIYTKTFKNVNGRLLPSIKFIQKYFNIEKICFNEV